MRLRPSARAVAVAATLLAVVAGCSDGSSEGTDRELLPTPAEHGEPGQLCTQVINERDPDVVEAGRDASLDVVRRRVAGDAEATDAEVDAGVAAMRAWRDVLAADRDRLGRLIVDDDEAWAVVVETVDAQVRVLDDRIHVLGSDDLATALAGLERDEGPTDGFVAAIDALGLSGRDCEVVHVLAGPPAAHATFGPAAAMACATVVSRRVDSGFRDDALRVAEAVVGLVEGEAPAATDDLIEVLERLVVEWEATGADLSRVPTDDAPDPAAWEQGVALAADRVAAFERRADALRSGDADEVAVAWSPDALGQAGFEGFGPNGLAERDCRSIEA